MKRAMIVVAADYETHAPSLAALKKQSSVARKLRFDRAPPHVGAGIAPH
jgi:hypothetical protein